MVQKVDKKYWVVVIVHSIYVVDVLGGIKCFKVSILNIDENKH